MFGAFVEKYQSLKRNYLNRSPRQKWKFVQTLGIYILKPSGVTFLDPNFKLYWNTYIPILLCIEMVVSYLYTVWYYIDTPVKAILIWSEIGLLVPVNKT